jgi:Ser/Thr protein kinase RdoA (MazF antagonist)
MFWENGYRYREGVPIAEYYYNCGKTLGKMHQLSKEYTPKHKRYGFFDKFNAGYIDKLIPDSYPLLKMKMAALLETLGGLEKNRETFGMVHFDFNDGNYFIDFDTGQITVYDFDNSCYCWYLFDLASVWGNGTGWIQHEESAQKRKEFMDEYFKIVLEGYKSETVINDAALDDLPIFIKANLAEEIVSHFECLRDGDNDGMEEERVSNAIKCLEEDMPYNGFFLENRT